MDTKIELKIKTFEYIIFKIKEWRASIVPKKEYKVVDMCKYVHWGKDGITTGIHFFIEERPSRIPIELTKSIELSLLFICCLAVKDKDRPRIFSIFDNFIAFLDEGMIEKDISDNYLSTLNINISEKTKDENVPYDIIDDAIAYLKERIGDNILYRSEKHWYDAVIMHTIWMVFAVKDGKNVPTNLLINEKSVYGRSETTGIFG